MSTELRISDRPLLESDRHNLRILFGCHRNENSFIANSMSALRGGRKGTTVEIGKELFWQSTEQFDIVNLQWPESMFEGWWHLDDDQVKHLCGRIDAWKRMGARVCITRHNIKPHAHRSDRDCLAEIFARVDGVIHFGKASQTDFDNRYGRYAWSSSLIHAVVPHPGYFELPNATSRKEARDRLEIGHGRKVVLVFGSLRSHAEAKFVQRVFRRLQVKEKLLVVPRWFRSYTKLAQLGRQLGIYQDGVPRGDQYRIGFGFVEDPVVQLYVNSADVVLVPRVSRSCLNSGVIPLALTFARIPVGPDVGVMGELLRLSNNPMYTDESSASNAIETVLMNPDSNTQEIRNAEFARKHLSLEIVGQRLFDFYQSLLKPDKC